MSGRVWQLVPVLRAGDALGDHALRLAAALGELHGGFVVERAEPPLDAMATDFREARVGRDDAVLYHVVLSSQLAEWLRRVEARKAIDYHNVTPPQFFRAYDMGLATALANARIELAGFAEQVSLAVAHSEYSRRELEELGYARTETVPVLVDFGRYDVTGNEALLERLLTGKDGPGDILFVGRLAPNKRQEDVVKAFAVYRRVFNPRARLFLVGGSDAPSYTAALTRFVERLGVEEVHMPGRVSHEDLVAHYRAADVFVSMSEHEGFCVPLLEAMRFGVPVVAHAAAAVPETLGEAGALFGHKDYEEVAALIDLVVRDAEVRARLAEEGRRRLARFRPDVHGRRMAALLGELLG